MNRRMYANPYNGSDIHGEEHEEIAACAWGHADRNPCVPVPVLFKDMGVETKLVSSASVEVRGRRRESQPQAGRRVLR